MHVVKSEMLEYRNASNAGPRFTGRRVFHIRYAEMWGSRERIIARSLETPQSRSRSVSLHISSTQQ